MSATTPNSNAPSTENRRPVRRPDRPKELDMMEAHKADVERFRGAGGIDNTRGNMSDLVAAHRRAYDHLMSIDDRAAEAGMTAGLKAEYDRASHEELAAAAEFLAAFAEVRPGSEDDNVARQYLKEARGQNFTIEASWEMPRAWLFILRDHYRAKAACATAEHNSVDGRQHVSLANTKPEADDLLLQIARAAVLACESADANAQKAAHASNDTDKLYCEHAQQSDWERFDQLRPAFGSIEATTAAGAMLQLAEAWTLLDLIASSLEGFSETEKQLLVRLIVSPLRYLERINGMGLADLGFERLRSTNCDPWEPVERRLAVIGEAARR